MTLNSVVDKGKVYECAPWIFDLRRERENSCFISESPQWLCALQRSKWYEWVVEHAETSFVVHSTTDACPGGMPVQCVI